MAWDASAKSFASAYSRKNEASSYSLSRNIAVHVVFSQIFRSDTVEIAGPSRVIDWNHVRVGTVTENRNSTLQPSFNSLLNIHRWALGAIHPCSTEEVKSDTTNRTWDFPFEWRLVFEPISMYSVMPTKYNIKRAILITDNENGHLWHFRYVALALMTGLRSFMGVNHSWNVLQHAIRFQEVTGRRKSPHELALPLQHTCQS